MTQFFNSRQTQSNQSMHRADQKNVLFCKFQKKKMQNAKPNICPRSIFTFNSFPKRKYKNNQNWPVTLITYKDFCQFSTAISGGLANFCTADPTVPV
jgi:hypothetical protein